ncbi:MAG: hypothetical protein LBF61_08960 [Azoarcus sp.]|jgi:hypothetical protein|nr:hypothetical protein [Azoarcus sp.]
MGRLPTVFTVFPYSVEGLVQRLASGSGQTAPEDVSKKIHVSYFKRYFDTLKAATVVVEPGYIDRDYLEDHAAYYDRCFQDYKRRTQRLHFFSEAFTQKQFARLLRDLSAEPGYDTLRESYLGFIVVKPLPQTIIGRTCLKTYDLDGGRRRFPCLHNYCVNLYGLALEVQSLPYQEQDTVVAACATSALWTCFHGTGRLFQHKIPAPFEITKWAEDYIPESPDVGARVLPNNGLTYAQMAYSIRRVGLEPFVDAACGRHWLNGIVYAYLQGRIPSILLADLVDHEAERNGEIRQMGGHAIALAGFSLGDARAMEYGKTGFLLRASRIDHIYGHDDQVGPFARMAWKKIHSPSSDAQAADEAEWLETSWRGKGRVYAIPNHILLPLYHKIRIPFTVIHGAMLALDVFLERARVKNMPGLNRAEWDIFLTTCNDYKTTIRKDYKDAGIDIAPSLLATLPRFLWRVMVRVDEELQLDFLFDATGIERHDLFVHAVSTRKGYAQILEVTASEMQSMPYGWFHNLPVQTRAVLKWFSRGEETA